MRKRCYVNFLQLDLRVFQLPFNLHRRPLEHIGTSRSSPWTLALHDLYRCSAVHLALCVLRCAAGAGTRLLTCLCMGILSPSLLQLVQAAVARLRLCTADSRAISPRCVPYLAKVAGSLNFVAGCTRDQARPSLFAAVQWGMFCEAQAAAHSETAIAKAPMASRADELAGTCDAIQRAAQCQRILIDGGAHA